MMPFWGSIEHFMIAVESVRGQTDPNWRLTIVDDVYPDLAAGEWAKSIDDPRITYIRNDENLRPSRNYNKSVGLAQSEFVVIMGCDDVMLPGYVWRVRELIAEFPDADIIQPGVTVIDEAGRPVTPLADRVKAVYRPSGTGARQLAGEALAASVLRGYWPYFPSLVWRTSRVASGFRTDLDVTQDLAMTLEIAKAGGSLVVDDEVVFAYRRHSASVSAVTGPDGSKFRQERTLFEEAEEACRALGWERAARIAHNHVSSRLHALTELPGAIVKGNQLGIRTLTRHVLRRPY
jgi:glycosyltransferase involved in cell wall biosynthesis